jgi:hypothetical protein
LTGLLKNLNYAPSDSDDYRRLVGEIKQFREAAS